MVSTFKSFTALFCTLICQGTTTGAIYGDGTYFATDASYSLDYAPPLASGQRQLLVAEVRRVRVCICFHYLSACRLAYYFIHQLEDDILIIGHELLLTHADPAGCCWSLYSGEKRNESESDGVHCEYCS